jgi:hypothetical protein
MGKRKGTIGQTMIYKNKLQTKLKTEKQELNIGVNSGASLFVLLSLFFLPIELSFFDFLLTPLFLLLNEKHNTQH